MAYDPQNLKPDAAAGFARTFLGRYLTPAFGALSKSEIDQLVFGCLIAAGAFKADDPIYEIARALNITPARARTLVLNWQLRDPASAGDLRPQIIAALLKTRFSSDGSLMTFGVESPLLREEISARLRRKGVFADASFSKELVRMPVDAFVEFLDDFVDDNTRKAIKAVLVGDKQLPDKSFKALAIGALTKLGEKVVGEAADGVAKGVVDGAGDLLKSLFGGNAEAAAKSLVSAAKS